MCRFRRGNGEGDFESRNSKSVGSSFPFSLSTSSPNQQLRDGVGWQPTVLAADALCIGGGLCGIHRCLHSCGETLDGAASEFVFKSPIALAHSVSHPASPAFANAQQPSAACHARRALLECGRIALRNVRVSFCSQKSPLADESVDAEA